jgi:hypothetical protein
MLLDAKTFTDSDIIRILLYFSLLHYGDNFVQAKYVDNFFFEINN